MLLRGKKVEVMLWLSLAIVTIFGGLTIWLHNPLFIKWKPTILYWDLCLDPDLRQHDRKELHS